MLCFMKFAMYCLLSILQHIWFYFFQIMFKKINRKKIGFPVSKIFVLRIIEKINLIQLPKPCCYSLKITKNNKRRLSLPALFLSLASWFIRFHKTVQNNSRFFFQLFTALFPKRQFAFISLWSLLILVSHFVRSSLPSFCYRRAPGSHAPRRPPSIRIVLLSAVFGNSAVSYYIS